ncbi:MAG TPA: hypothetical protein VN108_11360 [Marmoricola sp.]|nr:hypothetical protein [Marmoricola sp.]
MTRGPMAKDEALTREALLGAGGVVLIGLGVRSNDWPMFGAGVAVLVVVVGASVIFALKHRVPTVSSGEGLRTIIARPPTWLTSTGSVLLIASLFELGLGVTQLRWVPCVVSVAAASQALLAYLLSVAQDWGGLTTRGRRRLRPFALPLTLCAMAVVLLAVNLGQFSTTG